MTSTSRFFSKFQQELPRVDGKVFCITGTTSGTGFVAARTAAEHGGEVVLLNRKSSRVEESRQRLLEAVPEGKFIDIECDLQDFASVRRAIDEIRSKYPRIYCLANNAGIMAVKDEATKDGYDTQMQTNHLSHFLLSAELYPLLKAEAEATGDARIVNHSSGARDTTKNKQLEEPYLGKNGGNLGGDEGGMLRGPVWERYAQSKLANSVFTIGLHQRLAEAGSKVKAICAHPGGSMTNLGNHLPQGWFIKGLIAVLGPFLFQSHEDAAAGFIKGMVDPTAESGVLYGPKNSGSKGWPVPNPPKAYENDPKSIEMLWEKSEEATGAKFTF